MPFVTRDNLGGISSISASPTVNESESEFLEASHSEILAYLSALGVSDKKVESFNALESSDKNIARITEDVINLLIKKQTILFTELPDAVQKKLLNREKLRADFVETQEVSFLDDEESI